MHNTKVQDCKFYLGTNNNITQTYDNCVVCNKDWLNYMALLTLVTCTDKGQSPEYCGTTINNCLQNVCYYDSNNYYRSCKMCSKNYTGSGAWQTGGYPECSTSGTITDCEYHDTATATITCYSCKPDYAVASTGTSCTSFTADKNCRTLASSNQCYYCYQSYYWSLTECQLKSNLLGISYMLVFLIMILYI